MPKKLLTKLLVTQLLQNFHYYTNLEKRRFKTDVNKYHVVQKIDVKSHDVVSGIITTSVKRRREISVNRRRPYQRGRGM